MRILNYSFETVLHMDGDVSEHSFVLRCQPVNARTQTVLDAQTIIAPACSLSSQTDGFGNLLQVGRIARPHREFSFYSTGMVLVDAAGADAEPAHPMYTRSSRYAAPSAEIARFAEYVLRVQMNAPVWDKANLLSRELHKHMAYRPGTTDVHTDAATAFAQGSGVCQDYTHILIALLRSQGMAARYVNGLMEGEGGATHAWVEVHDGTCWRGIDPTNDRPVDDDYIVLARGRDSSDCPIESGVFRGDAEQSQSVSVVVEEQFE